MDGEPIRPQRISGREEPQARSGGSPRAFSATRLQGILTTPSLEAAICNDLAAHACKVRGEFPAAVWRKRHPRDSFGFHLRTGSFHSAPEGSFTGQASRRLGRDDTREGASINIKTHIVFLNILQIYAKTQGPSPQAVRDDGIAGSNSQNWKSQQSVEPLAEFEVS